MSRPNRKEEIITFKADESLSKALSGIRNRSEFIRTAILNALDSTCPLCMGTGILTPSQREHWEEFAKHHHVEECDSCHELHLICDVEESAGGDTSDAEPPRTSSGSASFQGHAEERSSSTQ